MNTNSPEDILDQYLAGRSAEAEKALVENWYNELSDQQNGVPAIDYERCYRTLKAGLPGPAKARVTRLWPRLAAAAVAVIILTAGLFYFNVRTQQQDAGIRERYAGDVPPGNAGAMLTLANGKKIRLSDAADGKLAEESGVRIVKSAEGEVVYEISGAADPDAVNTLSTAAGETYRLVLPDGTVVWLNSASTLTYSPGLVKQGKRRMRLQGEGFFHVAKNKTQPFVVEAGGQEIEVLGTQFNVNSYPEEPEVATTLLEGAVRVSSGAAQQVIHPGEQVSGNGDIGLKVRKVDADQVIDWKNGEFNLDDVDFKVAMRKIARWYNVEVVYDASVPANITSGGWISRDVKLSTILEGIERSGLVRFRVDGRKVYVMPPEKK